MKKHAFAIFKNTIFRKGRRISALALFVNVRLYRILLFKNIEQSKKLIRKGLRWLMANDMLLTVYDSKLYRNHNNLESLICLPVIT